METRKRVLVVIATYNGDRWLREALNSILNQTYDFIKIVAIDDGSTDDTLEILREFEVNNKERFFIQEKIGIKGAPSSRMEVINSHDCDYIAFIDQDDIWAPTKLERQVEALKNQGEEFSLCFTDVDIIDENGLLKPGEAKKENLNRRKLINCSQSKLKRAVICNCPIRIGTVLIEREKFMKLGGFDISLFGGEDWEFWVRYVLAGYNAYYLRDKSALRRVHGENTSIIHRNERLKSWLLTAKKIQGENSIINNEMMQFFIIKYITLNLRYINGNKDNALYSLRVLYKENNLLPSYVQHLLNFIVRNWNVFSIIIEPAKKLKYYFLKLK